MYFTISTVAFPNLVTPKPKSRSAHEGVPVVVRGGDSKTLQNATSGRIPSDVACRAFVVCGGARHELGAIASLREGLVRDSSCETSSTIFIDRV